MHVVHQRCRASSREARANARRGGCQLRIRPVKLSNGAKAYGVTVIEPFMFIAACGVQVKSYLPAGTLANETV